ncbi:hypothetical protein PC116_g2769 [Phytophthora cactorum]|nr:hypothetical protein Pcac1_g23905 [Phytophthora cactorum]KAG3201394.1 hypothetical protein PC128_g3953 [Phytophthora cactorum]KAG4061473.1 hypothetical protein PC123_g3630 [Phytophthora cactorum]KAG4249543.1 hypothetical protein PC116_g2769 [Phytophthora cactorum]
MAMQQFRARQKAEQQKEELRESLATQIQLSNSICWWQTRHCFPVQKAMRSSTNLTTLLLIINESKDDEFDEETGEETLPALMFTLPKISFGLLSLLEPK